MRRLVGFVVTLILLFAADSAARGFASARMTDGLETALDLEKEPQVLIGGFPFLWELIRGDFENISVSVDDYSPTEVAFEHASITFKEVSFSPIGALTGEIDEISFESARGMARVSRGWLEEFLSGTGPVVDDFSAEDVPGVGVEGTTLSLGPVDVELPVFMEAMSYESVEVVEDQLVLEFSIRAKKLRF